MIEIIKDNLIDKETVNFLNSFENKFTEEMKKILKSKDYKNLSVNYAIQVGESDGSENLYRIESNSSISLANSNKFISEVLSYLNFRNKEFTIFFSDKIQLLIRFNFVEKVNKVDKKDDNQPLTYIPIEPRYSFEQIILSDEIKVEIFDALNIIKYQELIYKTWEFEKVDPIPRSVLNFYGPPGTGKTMCAHAVAKELNKKLLALNYAEIESKYVGDAAKNLSNAFDTATLNDCVLFFDEADSFLGKRIKNVTQGADQALNSLRSQMLILLEEFSGVVIFATNLVSNFDHAFESRILKHIQFVLPNEDARIAIIKKTLPPKLPYREEITEPEYRELSKTLDGLSGREIKGAILECLLSKVSKDGINSLFDFGDFKIAFDHKKEALKKLQEEKSKDKKDKILQAFKNGNVKSENNSTDMEATNKDDLNQIDTREYKLIKLVAETGVFFGKCDGSYDENEKKFVHDYLDNISKRYDVSKNKYDEIINNVDENISIEALITKTNDYANDLIEQEKEPFIRTMSYFIYNLIRADNIIHPKETKCYNLWKKGLGIDDNINIDEYKN
jgi:AAA+ superfamily predicted ATPase